MEFDWEYKDTLNEVEFRLLTIQGYIGLSSQRLKGTLTKNSNEKLKDLLVI
jgi:hypothetical protein